MTSDDDSAPGARPGEVSVTPPDAFDAGLWFIGRIRTPWTRRGECPTNAAGSDAPCTIELDPRWQEGLADLETCTHVIVLYWMDRAPRTLVVQQPRHYATPKGVFALRSPARPNPIALSVARLVAIDGARITIRGIDCLDGTPLLDLKPYFASVDAKPAARVVWREKEGGSGGDAQ